MKVVFFHNAILPVLKYRCREDLYWHMVELVKQGTKWSILGTQSQVEDKGIQPSL